jgi:hypothetical protein
VMILLSWRIIGASKIPSSNVSLKIRRDNNRRWWIWLILVIRTPSLWSICSTITSTERLWCLLSSSSKSSPRSTDTPRCIYTQTGSCHYRTDSWTSRTYRSCSLRQTLIYIHTQTQSRVRSYGIRSHTLSRALLARCKRSGCRWRKR